MVVIDTREIGLAEAMRWGSDRGKELYDELLWLRFAELERGFDVDSFDAKAFEKCSIKTIACLRELADVRARLLARVMTVVAFQRAERPSDHGRVQ